MRIVYGVHGYGRGHAMRALAVLPELARRHEVRVFAGGDAQEALSPQYPVTPIPTLSFSYDGRGKLSNWLTLKQNLPIVRDLWFRGPALRAVEDQIATFAPDVIVSDSEVFTHRAATRLGIPRISFDHFSILVYCRPVVRGLDRLRAKGDTFVYRTLYGRPDRVIVSSFFDAPVRRPGVRVVGPVIRAEAATVSPTRGDHLLVYVSKGTQEALPRLQEALIAVGVPVRLYGAGREGVVANIEFKPIANLPFIHDLASCRAVIGTTGNQLLGEVAFFRKPILGLPVECLEQRLNAAQIAHMGIGTYVRRNQIDADTIRDFLSREDQYRAAFKTSVRSAADEAVEAIEEFATELAAGRSASPQSPRNAGCVAQPNRMDASKLSKLGNLP